MRRITAQLLAVIAITAVGFAAATGGEPDKDPQMMKLLQDARHHIDSKNPAAAIAKCDTVINAYKAHYGGSKQKVFCARSPEESLGLMMKAAVDKNNAIALSFIWSDAYFMKAYALEDLGRMDEAKATLQQALKMSPFNAQYLAEMGQIYAREKNWSKAEQLYREAEDNASLSPPASKADDLARLDAASATFSSSLGSSTRQRRNISSVSQPTQMTRRPRQSFSTSASRKLSGKDDE